MNTSMQTIIADNISCFLPCLSVASDTRERPLILRCSLDVERGPFGLNVWKCKGAPVISGFHDRPTWTYTRAVTPCSLESSICSPLLFCSLQFCARRDELRCPDPSLPWLSAFPQIVFSPGLEFRPNKAAGVVVTRTASPGADEARGGLRGRNRGTHFSPHGRWPGLLAGAAAFPGASQRDRR